MSRQTAELPLELQSAPSALTASPGTPGEGRGEGLALGRDDAFTLRRASKPFLIPAASLLALALVSITATVSAQASYPVVPWTADAAHRAAGDRVVAVMESRGLHPVVTCSAGCTLSVPTAEYGTALSIASELVAREHLDIRLEGALPTS